MKTLAPDLLGSIMLVTRITSKIIFLLGFLQSQAFSVVVPKTSPLLRVEGDMHHLRSSSGDRYLAFTNKNGQDLRYIELSSGNVYPVTDQFVGAGFFWTPDGMRLVYREVSKQDKQIQSAIKVFDTKLKKSVEIDRFQGGSGFPSFDPQEQKYFVMKDTLILSRSLVYPNERLAKWQKSKKRFPGHWLVTNQKVLRITNSGISMQALEDDSSGIQSFDISPDARMVTWATKNGQIYGAHADGRVFHLGPGRDPRWHPRKAWIAYSKPHFMGRKITHYNLFVTNLQGNSRQLTSDLGRNQRWPIWAHEGGKLFYTVENSTDLFEMEFKL